jgi:hypothetical protein
MQGALLNHKTNKMKTETNQTERKVMMGLRCAPELKIQLTEEAKDASFSLSEYCEFLLLNRENTAEKEVVFESTISEQKQYYDGVLQKKDLEIQTLKQENRRSVNLDRILKDPYLNHLFSELKGKTERIVLENGRTFEIHCREPEDVLRVMLYSFKLKK